MSSIAQGDPKPIHADADIMESWLADDRTWESVYSIKTYDYLEIIVKGGEPTWQKNDSGDGGKWVDKNLLEEPESGEEEELSIGGDAEKAETKAEVKTDSKKTKAEKPRAKEEVDSELEDEDDDLPF